MKKAVVVFSALAFILSGCASKSAKIPSPTKDRPAWVDQGSGAFPGDVGVAFYGVGVAEAKTHPTISSRRTASDLGARTELSQSFKSQINNLVKAYERVISDGEVSNVEVFMQQATTALSKLDLSGAFIVDRYFDPSEEAQYSLTRMAVSDFKKQIELLGQLSEEVERTILDNAEAAFGELVGQ